MSIPVVFFSTFAGLLWVLAILRLSFLAVEEESWPYAIAAVAVVSLGVAVIASSVTGGPQ
jgi:hypothetical protein